MLTKLIHFELLLIENFNLQIKNLFNFKKSLTLSKSDKRRSPSLINRLNMPFDLKILGKKVQFLDVRLKLLKPILCQR